jgi:hypothetical protein
MVTEISPPSMKHSGHANFRRPDKFGIFGQRYERLLGETLLGTHIIDQGH